MAGAEPLLSARPAQVGLSAERLERIGRVLNDGVEKGDIPGAVALVARKGRIPYSESFGFRDKASAAPMPKEAVFRIYSLTKPITSVAAWKLLTAVGCCA